ncbi:choice-of-anchor C family protein [Streptomyces cellulosae]|uniref:Choice-of-anchor C family protein n=1 Tax=Streptomyces cellulosae TaxID=1968 RepID=A0ABW7Y082_STRCE
MSTPTPDHFDDGGFEYPQLPPGSIQTYPAGQSFGPWRVVSGSVDLIGRGYWQAAEGGQSLDLNGNDPGAVSQTFATTPGTAYTVSYSLAGNAIEMPAVKTGKVRIDGQDIQDFSYDTTGRSLQDMGWVTRQVTFVATGSSTTLSFASTTASASGPVIDNITVSPTERACISNDSGNALTRGTDGCLYVPQPPTQPTLDPASCNAAHFTENGLRVPRTIVEGIDPGTSVGTERSVDIDVTETPGCPEIWTVGARLTPVSGITVAHAPFVSITPGPPGVFSYADVPALTVTLPEAGIYDLDVNIRYELNNNDGPASAYMSAMLKDTTAGVDVPDSATMLCHLNNANPQYSHSTVPINVRYQVSGPATITVRGSLFWQQHPVKSAQLGGTDGNGASRFRWTKISD